MASGLAAAIKKELGIGATLVKGVAGVFDVIANGEAIFSKSSEQRFPQNVEIIEALKNIES